MNISCVVFSDVGAFGSGYLSIRIGLPIFLGFIRGKICTIIKHAMNSITCLEKWFHFCACVVLSEENPLFILRNEAILHV